MASLRQAIPLPLYESGVSSSVGLLFFFIGGRTMHSSSTLWGLRWLTVPKGSKPQNPLLRILMAGSSVHKETQSKASFIDVSRKNICEKSLCASQPQVPHKILESHLRKFLGYTPDQTFPKQAKSQLYHTN